MSDCEIKSPIKSKLNVTGAILVLLGMVLDPNFVVYFGDLIPKEWYSRIMFVAGWLVIFLRTFKTDTKINLNWKNPFA